MYLARKFKLKDTFSKGDRRCNFMYLVLGKYHAKGSNNEWVFTILMGVVNIANYQNWQ